MIDTGDAYVEVQERLIDVVDDPNTDVKIPVPACPGWRVRDVVAHHVGVVVDVVNGELGDSLGGSKILDQWRDSEVQQARDAMTARQVEQRRRQSIQALIEEWRQATKAAMPVMRGEVAPPPPLPPFVGFILVNDLVVHETDIRAALAVSRAPATPALSLALSGFSFSLENRIRLLGLPSLVIAYDGKERQLGEGDVGATLRADRHELVRALAGRRTAEQILGLEWEGDPSPFLEILSEYGPVKTPTTD